MHDTYRMKSPPVGLDDADPGVRDLLDATRKQIGMVPNVYLRIGASPGALETYIDWTFGGSWPYAPRWFDTSNGRMHYMDEGAFPDTRDRRAPREGLHAFAHLFVFRAGIVLHERMTAQVRAAYLAPHATWSSRTPILVFPRQIPSGPTGPVADLCDAVHAGLAAFRDRPVMIAWAMKDIGFTPDILEDLWLADFPAAEVLRLENAGHYLQEDAHELIVPPMLEFLRRT